MTGGVSEGVAPGRFGLRNAPTSAYALFSPLPFFDPEPGTLGGGRFLDRRAADLEEQARGPFLNPNEMANPDGWDAPEVPDTRNCNELGNLKLSDQEIADLVAFLHTLTDGYLPR